MDEWMKDSWVDGKMDRLMDGGLSVWMVREADGYLDECRDGQIVECKVGTAGWLVRCSPSSCLP